MNSSQERRQFNHIAFDADTAIHQDNHAWSVVLIDISLKGLLIEEPFGWAIDKEKSLRATITLLDDVAIDMDVTFKHSENGQAGFECQQIDIDSIAHLRRLVELNLGDEKLLERELAALG